MSTAVGLYKARFDIHHDLAAPGQHVPLPGVVEDKLDGGGAALGVLDPLLTLPPQEIQVSATLGSIELRPGDLVTHPWTLLIPGVAWTEHVVTELRGDDPAIVSPKLRAVTTSPTVTVNKEILLELLSSEK